jgi:hypothetical protein
MKQGMQNAEVRMQKSELRGQKSYGLASPTTGRDGVLRRPRPRSSGRNESAHDATHAPRCTAERGADGASAPSLPLRASSSHPPSPEGTSDNSPAFQRWVKRDSAQVPKGRPNRTWRKISANSPVPDSLTQNSVGKTLNCRSQRRRRDLSVVPPLAFRASPVGAAHSAKIISNITSMRNRQTRSLLTKLGILKILFL